MTDEAAHESARTTAARPLTNRGAPRAHTLVAGISTSTFAVLALFALIAARGVAPALPGSATGISSCIVAATFVAACASQLLAAGGIALCIRLLGTLASLPSLGVAFRMAVLPTGLGVVALVAASIARPLESDLGKVLAICASVATAAAAPHLLVTRWARAAGAVLVIVAIANALTVWQIGATEATAGAFATTLGVVGWVLEIAGVVVALAWASRSAKEAAIALGGVALAVAAIAVLSLLGAAHDASGSAVLLYRSLEALGRRSLTAAPRAMSSLATLAVLLASAAVLIAKGRRADLRAAVSLSLLSMAVPTGAPASALLAVAGALLLAGATTDPHAAPEHAGLNH